MAQVTIQVNDRPYVVGCEDGQEQHLLELSQHFDRHVRQVGQEVGQLGERAAQGFLDHAINAAAREHAAAFHVHRAHRKAEQHDAENEPRGRRAHRLFGDAACVKS